MRTGFIDLAFFLAGAGWGVFVAKVFERRRIKPQPYLIHKIKFRIDA
jgi:hypothetical protein